MEIAYVKATVLKDRVFWAREIEDIVVIRSSQERQRSPKAPRVPALGSVLVEIRTRDGIVGWGLGGGGRPGAILVESILRPLLIGQNPLNTERLWDSMYRRTFRYGQAGIALMAISGVDLALWDLKGKIAEKPVWQLLGDRKHEDIPVYATIRDPLWAKERGFCGVKLGSPYGPTEGEKGMRKNEAFVAQIREEVGSDMKIMIDCARTWNVEYTLEMARILAPYDIAFIEEPILSQDIDGYARLRRTIDSTRIACGEHVYTRYAVQRLLERDAIDVIQPDIRWTGGLSETLKICDLAAAYNIPVIPHRGAMIWALHLIAAQAKCPLAEGIALTEEEAEYSIFEGEPVPVDGHLSLSTAPGFGVEVNRQRIPEFGTWT